MLWYKAWQETRIKLWIALGYISLIFVWLGTAAAVGPVHRQAGLGLSFMMPSFVTVICTWLAQAGITTQAPFQALKGLHGSTQFTLSLPVSRLRLLSVRAILGYMQVAALIGVFCWGLWLLAPWMRAGAAPVEMFEYALTLIAYGSSLYFLSVLLATFLDDQWRMGATIGASVVLWYLLPNLIHIPAYADIFRAMGDGSPLLAHTMPWGAMAFSTGLAAMLFAAAVKIAQRREY
jgi:hypothetical protein